MKIILVTFTILATFGTILTFSGFSEKKEHESMRLNQTHSDMFASRIKEGAQNVDLNEVVKLNWDRACIVTSYMSLGAVEAMLGFKFPDYLSNLEETWEIIFTHEKRVIGSIKIDRYRVIDYYKDNNVELLCLTKDQSVMSVVDKRKRPALMPIQE